MQEKNNLIDAAYFKAVDVLKKCSTPNGFFASGGKDGYNAVWARDSMITSLGASLVDDNLFKETFERSLITLAQNQSKNGQIPNCVDKWSKRKPHVDFKSIDSSLWYVIGHYVYYQRYKSKILFNKYEESVNKTFFWLRCQDFGENGMLGQLPTTDWQDAFPHKYGYTINTQALYYKLLTLIGEKKEAMKLREKINYNKDDGLWEKDFYLAYRWKNHNKYKEIGEWFDSLGNLLAIVFDLSPVDRAEKIINHIKSKKIDEPYPIKTIFPPIKKGDKEWQDYFADCEAGIPYNYANAGLWGYVGCFYVLALIKLKKFKDAENALKKLAEINIKGNFPEWTNPETKETNGESQAWEAGMYILAYESFKNKKILI